MADNNFYNVEFDEYPLHCICGWQYGIGVGVPAGHPNRHCFNQVCENSFDRRHPGGYNIQNCCGRQQVEDEGISEE